MVLPPECLDRERDGETPANWIHLLCQEFTNDDYCLRCRRAHLAELAAGPQAHWHACGHGRFCALIAVTLGDRLIAACRLVCVRSVEREEFLRLVQLLEVLIENFSWEAAGAPYPVPRGSQTDTSAPSKLDVPADASCSLPRTRHLLVRSALACIEERLADPGLTVAAIAQHLGTNSTYLAHLFSEEIGMHLSHHIAGRRIERAKHLLSTTTWLVKRIAYECGMAHPDWFSQVFRAHTGLTPSEYRRRETRY